MKIDKVLSTVLIILTILVVGVWAYLIGNLTAPQVYQPTKVYEDGSYYGCIEGGLCND